MLTFSTDCDIDYALPIVAGDVINFIAPASLVFWRGDDITQIQIGLGPVTCDEVQFLNIGTIEHNGDSLYCSIEIPEILTNCDYRVIFYSTVEPADCGAFEGFTLEEVIAENITLGQVVQCTLDDFIE